MHRLFTFSAVFTVFVAAFGIVGLSSANEQYYGTWGCYCNDWYYSTYSQESVPFYALHPPVYYSYPVARTYGLYPFPYAADFAESYSFSTPVEPKMVINRFVDQKAEKTALYTPQPLRIENPFVIRTNESNSVQRANLENGEAVKPRVIYPSKLASAN
jgi:hypothetical protein